jgi:serine/threonine protein kinase
VAVTGDLARYRFIARLGSGGMATVELAEDTVLGRRVALKRMLGAADSRGLSRLQREALVGASISHPNVVSIYDVVTDDEGHLIIVMEYVDGQTLREVLDRQGKPSASEAVRILQGVAAGLDAIHAQGIVHRDVKPSNILLGADGAVKVADLGIASVPDRTRITTSGSLLGSLNYMAPEQLEDAAATPAIDVYALAAVAYEVLSGVKARRAANPVALAHAIATQPPPSLLKVWPAAPPAVADVVRRGMSRRPEQRPGSAGELTERLRVALAPEYAAPVAPPPTEPSRVSTGRSRLAEPVTSARVARVAGAPRAPAASRSRRGLLAATLLGLVCLAVVLVVLLSSGSSPPPNPRADTARSADSRTKSTATSSPATSSAAASSPARSSTASSPATSSTAAGSAASTTSPTRAPVGAAGAPGPGAASPTDSSAAADPVSAVKSFYGLAASHRYAGAWALADPALRAQLGGYQSFQSGQAGDRSITFTGARIASQTGTSATVSVATRSVRTDGTHQCTGTVDLISGAPSGSWRLHQVHINCT